MDANTVGAVAALTGVSVRTLHHYDHIGLVVPSVRTPAGYRGYIDADIERLHLVLVYRCIGMPLDEIRTLLDDPSADVLGHLRRQHGLLLEQAERLQHTIKAVEELMDAHRQGIQLTAEQQVEIFGTTAFSEEYAAEAEERWGETDAWKQSQQRVSQFSKQNWVAIKAEGDTLLEALAEAKRGGVEPGSAEADELAAPAPRVDRAALRLRRRDAPQSCGDVSGRRTVHPLLRRCRAGPGAVPARHRGGKSQSVNRRASQRPR